MGIRGVNLGNWLVLEKWMGTSPLSAAQAPDDRGLIDELPEPQRVEALARHYESYVTEETFAWLAEAGVDVARIPIPYHLFGSPHHQATVQYLDHAFNWAEKYGIGILIDLHTVPYSQNGFDNGGYMGLCAWAQNPDRVDAMLSLLDRIAERYAGRPALWGIEPLNEPASEAVLKMNLANFGKNYPERVINSQVIPREVLVDYYERFYQRVRPIVGPEVRLVFHDQFELTTWADTLVGPEYENVWIDTHLYLNFADGGFTTYDLPEYLEVLAGFEAQVVEAQKTHPVMVGEWCLGNHSPYVRSLPEDQQAEWYRTLAEAQLAAWDKGEGGCYWSYRVECPGRENWSLQHCVEHGWIDLHYGK